MGQKTADGEKTVAAVTAYLKRKFIGTRENVEASQESFDEILAMISETYLRHKFKRETVTNVRRITVKGAIRTKGAATNA